MTMHWAIRYGNETHKCTWMYQVYYKHSIPPVCFGHSCGLPVGGELHRMDTSRYYKSSRTNAQM